MSTAAVLDHPATAALRDSKPTLILTIAEKGGVGKTTTARALECYLAEHGIVADRYDAEGDSGTFRRFYPEGTVSSIDFSNGVTIAPVLDRLMTPGSSARHALVDVGARSTEEITTWLRDGGALAASTAGELRIILVYLMGITAQSVFQFRELYDALTPEGPTYVIVLNEGLGNDFSTWHQSETRKLLLEHVTEINLPALNEAAYVAVDRAMTSFSNFARDRASDGQVVGGYSFTFRNYVRAWLQRVFEAFNRIPHLKR